MSGFLFRGCLNGAQNITEGGQRGICPDGAYNISRLAKEGPEYYSDIRQDIRGSNWRGLDLNQRPGGYGPPELPLLYPAAAESITEGLSCQICGIFAANPPPKTYKSAVENVQEMYKKCGKNAREYDSLDEIHVWRRLIITLLEIRGALLERPKIFIHFVLHAKTAALSSGIKPL